jgi:hypothetical protein
MHLCEGDPTRPEQDVKRRSTEFLTFPGKRSPTARLRDWLTKELSKA